MLYDEYDSFTFMVIVLFVIFMLIIFMSLIAYNIQSKPRPVNNKFNSQNPNNNVQPTISKCIPKPTPLPLNQQFY